MERTGIKFKNCSRGSISCYYGVSEEASWGTEHSGWDLHDEKESARPSGVCKRVSQREDQHDQTQRWVKSTVGLPMERMHEGVNTQWSDIFWTGKKKHVLGNLLVFSWSITWSAPLGGDCIVLPPTGEAESGALKAILRQQMRPRDLTPLGL